MSGRRKLTFDSIREIILSDMDGAGKINEKTPFLDSETCEPVTQEINVFDVRVYRKFFYIIKELFCIP